MTNKQNGQLSNNRMMRSMLARMGYSSAPNFTPNQVDGVNLQAARLVQEGGLTQDNRMIRDKKRSLDKAVLYSYQRAFVRKDTQEFDFQENEFREPPAVRALINPNKLKFDYDDKIISIGFEHDFHTGDIFEWVNTGTYWIIYSQDLTELAYFRGDIRKCNYDLEWIDDEGHHKTKVAVRGPVETKINYIQKHGISVDTPNHSLDIYMPKTEAALKYFQRYSKFYLQDGTDAYKVCWRVEAMDWISTPGVLEINGVEYYANEFEDDVNAGIVGALKITEENPNSEEVENTIIGETFIKPKTEYIYQFDGVLQYNWEVDKSLPIVLYIDPDDYTHVKLKWDSSYSGQFDLKYGDFIKTIVVESLF